MYPQQRPLGPPPNYTLRRLAAVTVLVVVLLLVYWIARSLSGGDDGGGERLSVGQTTTTTSSTIPNIEEPPSCDDGDEPAIYDRPEDWFRTIVDPIYALPDDYVPPDLVPASEAGYSAEYSVRELVIEDLNAMRNAILAAGVPEVAILAGYRSIEEQQALYERRVAELGEEDASDGTARPGHSEHHLGTTIDVRLIGETDVDQSFGETETGRWLEDNSFIYGFVLSYPEGETDVTCYKYEPWHFRYVGPDLAKRIEDSGLTLREYLWHWEVRGTEPGASTSAVTSTTTAPAEAGGDGDGE